MSSSKGNKNKWVREINIRMGESPCEPVKKLLYVIDADEVISEAESKYREHEPLFNNYKQLNNETSLEWFCNPKLIKSYEYWDCKNLDKYKPSKAEQEKIKKAGKWMQQNKPLIDQKRKELENLEKQITPAWKKLVEAEQHKKDLLNKAHYGSARWAQLQLDQKTARHIAQQYQPLIEKLRNAQNLTNSLITDKYISTAERALETLGGRSSLRGMIDSIQPYQNEVDRILSRGVDAQTAWNMLEPHRGVTENLQFRLRAYEQEEQPKETEKQLRKIIESKDKELESKDEEIAELKALLATQEKQDKKIEKQTRTHQLHVLIAKVDNELTKLSNGIRPQAQIVWNTIEENYYDYDDEAIIQEVKDNTIFWKSKKGIEQSLPFTSFSATLSSIRKKNKNN